MVLAVALSAMVLFGWTLFAEKFFPATAPQRPAIEAARNTAVDPATRTAGGVPAVATAPVLADAAQAIAASPRLAIETPRLKGTINLRGARFDDLVMTNYKVTLAKDSPPVRLLAPSGAKDSQFGQFGWTGAGAPPADALWTASGSRLTPQTPVTLSWTSPTGAVFEQVVSVDNDFMFTVRQRIRNLSAAPLAVQPWGLVSRLDEAQQAEVNVHVGPVGVLDGTLKDSEITFDKLRDDGAKRFASTGGWLGLSEKYWLAAVVPDQKLPINATFQESAKRFQADYLGPLQTVPAGRVLESDVRFFAGAKEVDVLDRYTEAGIPRLDKAVSWGWFEVIAKPIFYLLDKLFHLFGNFGWAIIGLTVIVRALLFPIANKQYESMAKMRLVGPRMKIIQEKYKDDKLRAQQEMMNLYKTEKVNPLAGCLPILLQIPIFYALYKTLLVSIEMRHQPFALWIKDLSAPDPLTPLNLFGLIPWQPPAVIALGVLPILLGVTMWVQQKLNPTPLDPVQKQVFGIMPWVLMFVMAPFAAGLQLYWATNNILSIAQQWYMLKKYPAPATPPAEAVVEAKATQVTAGPAPRPRPAGPGKRK